MPSLCRLSHQDPNFFLILQKHNVKIACLHNDAKLYLSQNKI